MIIHLFIDFTSDPKSLKRSFGGKSVNQPYYNIASKSPRANTGAGIGHGSTLITRDALEADRVEVSAAYLFLLATREACADRVNNGPFAASGHMVHAGGQAAHWDIQNKENSNFS